MAETTSTKRKSEGALGEEKVEKKVKEGEILVAFEGSEGAYSEEAAFSYFRSNSIDEIGSPVRGEGLKTVGVNSFRDVFKKVESGEVNYGICPIENSESGSFRSVYDLLLKYKLWIIGEISTQEEHCLCAHEGVQKSDLERVYSHSDVIDQCQSYLNGIEKKNGRPLLYVLKRDTAGSCQSLRESKRRDSAAIASKRAATLNGLVVLDQNIGDDTRIRTRYIILAKAPAVLPNEQLPIKTSICVTLRNEPGSLVKCLSCFSLRGVNLIKFEARPLSKGRDMFIDGRQWDYLFYLDFSPPSQPKVAKGLMDNLNEFCVSVRELGTYVTNLPVPLTYQLSEWVGIYD